MYRPLVSVMIPFYNSRETLTRCLDSIVAQTYRPLELLLVDDCSLDGSHEIVERYIAKNNDDSLLIRLMRQSGNQGVSAARIVAIQSATGEYITAVDADDYIDPQTISEYVAAARMGEVDIVAAGMTYDYSDRSTLWLFKPNEQLHLSQVTINAFHFSLNNKLIRTSLLQQISGLTPGHDCWEDLGTVARLLAIGATTTILNKGYYHYVQESYGSITKSASDKILHQHIEVARSLEEWMCQHGYYKENEQFMLYLKFIAKVKYLRNISALLRHPLGRLRQWRDTFPEVNSHIMSFKHVPLHYRIMFYGAHIVSHMLPGK
ncbi:MAG: glycosyltransferase [Muribaculaceae bacterium]|nr:glycosyltransferase [Muribaculaceae bacterium]